MIQFSLEDQQVRFDINLDAASRAGLKISSRLLVLARIVKDQGGNAKSGDSPIPSQPFKVAVSYVPSGDRDLEQESAQAAASAKESDQRPGSR
jgi:hypothetical protein